VSFRFALVGSTLAALLGCESDRREAPPNIVMIVLDTARPDLLSVYGYPRPTSPFLESFARSGTRFDRAYSSSSWTLPAHGSLFTGMPAELHQANQTQKRVADSIALLPERLRDAGYQTAGFSGNMWVSELSGLDRGFDHFENLNKGIYLPRLRKLARDREGKRTPAGEHYIARRVDKWLAEERDPERPLFLFVNLVEPHLPYLPHWDAARHFMSSPRERWESIRRFYPGGVASDYLVGHYARERTLSQEDRSAVASMYLGALRTVDEIAGALVASADAALDPERTLVFILSDHGENLGDHGHVTHIFNLYDSNLRILCLARGPGFPAGAVEDGLVHITDLHATALAAAGIAPGPDAAGLDLRRGVPADRVLSATLDYPSISLALFPEAVSGTGVLDAYKVELRAAVGPRYKLILSTDPGGKPVREEIFDLVEDPNELSPLDPSSVNADVLLRLRTAIRDSMSLSRRGRETPLDELDEETIESLRALGYVR
jgi:arylsulfatase A-like enzyme